MLGYTLLAAGFVAPVSSLLSSPSVVLHPAVAAASFSPIRSRSAASAFLNHHRRPRAFAAAVGPSSRRCNRLRRARPGSSPRRLFASSPVDANFETNPTNAMPSNSAAAADGGTSSTQSSALGGGNAGDFANASKTGHIPTFDGDEKARATDYANYFCSYAQLYHQKQMLADHNRMAAYHAAIMGNAAVFKDKVVMDVGTGSGILAVWAAKAGARRVYAVEYTDMANHARSVMEANGVSDVVTILQGAVEDVVLPAEEHLLEPEEGAPLDTQVVDIMISEWMGYFLLRESMLDSLIAARDKFLKPGTGLMMPSHATMYVAPIQDEEDRKASASEYAGAMGDWAEFVESTRGMYGVDMGVLERDFEREQREYYLLSSRWAELRPEQVLAEPAPVKDLDMATCTLDDARGMTEADDPCSFDFDVNADERGDGGPVSGFAGWFTVDFKSRTDDVGKERAPTLPNPAHLSTAPEDGYTHWGQQTFHLPSSIPLIHGETTRLRGSVELTRTKENLRLYNCRLRYASSRRKTGSAKDAVLMQGEEVEHVYQIL